MMEMEAWLSPNNTPWSGMPNLIVLVKRYEHTYGDLLGPSHLTFHSHSGSSKVTRIDPISDPL